MKFVLMAALFLVGCAHGIDPVLPKLPGPADYVDCSITRGTPADEVAESPGTSLEGRYRCVFEGRYIMEGVGLF